jgi:ATP-binding protein involved in chromosome partitioning
MNENDIRVALAPFNLGKMLDGVHAEDGLVQVSLAIKREDAQALEPVRAKIETTLAALPGVQNASVVFTAHRAGPPSSRPETRAAVPRREPPPAPQATAPLPDIKNIIAVASGKGGVGKSTVAVNLAVALAQGGLRVGLLDADIYGPSLPRMLGLNVKPEVKEGMIQPLHAWGVSCMSIGFLVTEETAMIWRGPMVTGALNQMLTQVAWGALDVLVVDMPPGTGDIQLSLAQKTKLRGAVVVSTPQDIALIDARRGVKMFEQLKVPVLGIVENMSYFCCPNCNHRSDIFGHGGARDEAERIGVPYLGGVPLLLAIRETGDAGMPIIASAPDGEAADAYRVITENLLASIAVVAAPRGGE